MCGVACGFHNFVYKTPELVIYSSMPNIAISHEK